MISTCTSKNDWPEFSCKNYDCIHFIPYREYKLSSSTSHPVSLGSHSRKAQDKENKGRSTSTTKSHSVKTTTLTSSSSKWNRRHPSTTSSGGSGQTAFIKSVKLHHGNGMPIGGGGGLLRSREPTTLIA